MMQQVQAVSLGAGVVLLLVGAPWRRPRGPAARGHADFASHLASSCAAVP